MQYLWRFRSCATEVKDSSGTRLGNFRQLLRYRLACHMMSARRRHIFAPVSQCGNRFAFVHRQRTHLGLSHRRPQHSAAPGYDPRGQSQGRSKSRFDARRQPSSVQPRKRRAYAPDREIRVSAPAALCIQRTHMKGQLGPAFKECVYYLVAFRARVSKFWTGPV